jgi:hypothetical protein
MNWPKMLGFSIILSSIQFSIGSVEMSSKFSVINFANTQPILQNAADALRNYLYIGGMWTIATILVMWGQYGLIGGIIGLIANLVYIAWIYFSYVNSFKKAAEKYNLEMPKIF